MKGKGYTQAMEGRKDIGERREELRVGGWKDRGRWLSGAKPIRTEHERLFPYMDLGGDDIIYSEYGNERCLY